MISLLSFLYSLDLTLRRKKTVLSSQKLKVWKHIDFKMLFPHDRMKHTWVIFAARLFMQKNCKMLNILEKPRSAVQGKPKRLQYLSEEKKLNVVEHIPPPGPNTFNQA